MMVQPRSPQSSSEGEVYTWIAFSTAFQLSTEESLGSLEEFRVRFTTDFLVKMTFEQGLENS